MIARTTIRSAMPTDAPALAQLRWDFRSARGGMTETEAAFTARCAAWMADALTPAVAVLRRRHRRRDRRASLMQLIERS
jgi:hypothetical protein